jgi:hypothetical protein
LLVYHFGIPSYPIFRYFGIELLSEEEVSLLNEIYKRADLLDNFFIANFKLKDKIKNNKGKTVKKMYENPKTPYQRLLESDSLTENQKQILIKTFNNLNMVKLRNEINKLTNKLYNIQLRKNNSNFNDINMIQPVHSFNDNLL